MSNIIKWCVSVFTMTRGSYLFRDMISGEKIFEYTDHFNTKWLAPYRFYPWSFRLKKTDGKFSPCKFDHNGECLLCDCWVENCAYYRYINDDFTYESKDELLDLFRFKIKEYFIMRRWEK